FRLASAHRSCCTSSALALRSRLGRSSQDCQGFFAIDAELATSDAALTSALRRAAETRAQIGWRCVLLEAIGWVSKVENGERATRFVLAVDELTYHQPGSRREG